MQACTVVVGGRRSFGIRQFALEHVLFKAACVHLTRFLATIQKQESSEIRESKTENLFTLHISSRVAGLTNVALVLHHKNFWRQLYVTIDQIYLHAWDGRPSASFLSATWCGPYQ